MSQNRFLNIVRDYYKPTIEPCPFCKKIEHVFIYQELSDNYFKLKCSKCEVIWIREGEEND